MDGSPERLNTRPEAAAQLRLQIKTLDNWRAKGRGPKYLKLGDRVLYPQSALDEYKASCLRDPSQRVAA